MKNSQWLELFQLLLARTREGRADWRRTDGPSYLLTMESGTVLLTTQQSRKGDPLGSAISAVLPGNLVSAEVLTAEGRSKHRFSGLGSLSANSMEGLQGLEASTALMDLATAVDRFMKAEEDQVERLLNELRHDDS